MPPAITILRRLLRDLGFDSSESAQLFMSLDEDAQRPFWDDLEQHVISTRGTA